MSKIKALTFLLASMAMSGGMPVFDNSKEKNKSIAPKPFDVNLTEIPKGHKTDGFYFEYDCRGYKYTIDLQFSYGSDDARRLRLIRRQKEAQQYIIETPIEKIIEFGQFKVEKIEK